MNKEPLSLGGSLLRAAGCALLLLLAAFVGLALLALVGQFIFELPVHFLFGWFWHATRTLPAQLGKWPDFLLPAGCLAMAGILLHRFVVRWTVAKQIARPWRVADTASCLALVLLGSGAAIALSGVAHQSVWLAGERWTDRRRSAPQTVAMNHGRQLMWAITEFHTNNDRYPHSWDELAASEEFLPRLVWVDSRAGSPKEPFILLCPGEIRPMLDEEPVIVSPILRDSDRAIVGYGDLSVRAVNLNQLSRTLQENQIRRARESRAQP